MKKKRIVAIQLVNDYSESSLIFRNILEGLPSAKYQLDLIELGSSIEIFDVKNKTDKHYLFKSRIDKLRILINQIFRQFVLFIRLLKYIRIDSVFYVNSIIPFGALFAGKLLRKKIVCHIQQTALKSLPIKNILLRIVDYCANEVIYFSEYLSNQDQLKSCNKNIVYNTLSNEFIRKANNHYPSLNGRFTVLMLSSFIESKGVIEFVELAKRMPLFNFELVVFNGASQDIENFFCNVQLQNLNILSSQKRVNSFYRSANLVLNLSHPDQWEDSFSIIALEAMCYGIPIIAPPIRGIDEIIDNGVNGFKIHQNKSNQIERVLRLLSINLKLYNKLSVNAKLMSHQFSYSKRQSLIMSIIHNSFKK